MAKGKLLLIGLGVGVGYVLGAKAGRERYDQITATVGRVWHSPLVQKQFDRTVTFVNDRVDDLGNIAAVGAKNLVDWATGGKRRRRAAAEANTIPPAE